MFFDTWLRISNGSSFGLHTAPYHFPADNLDNVIQNDLLALLEWFSDNETKAKKGK